MTTTAPSARPPWAVTCWVDNGAVYTEVPALTGPPLIQKYDLCDSGLNKALSFMRDLHRKHQPLGGDYKITLQANIKKVGVDYSQAQRQKARDILRRLKIT